MRIPPRVALALAAAAAMGGLLLFGRALICGLSHEAVWCRWWPHLRLESVEDFIRGLGPWGLAASIGLMVLHSFVPFPAELLAIANGAVYGPVLGTAVTWTGAMLGGFLAFGLARFLGRPFVLKMLSPKQEYLLESWVERLGPEALLLGRFVPVISFNLINYAAGLTPVSWWTFAWTTGLGILPLTSLMVLMGDRLDDAPWWMWIAALAAAALLWLMAHLWLRHRRRK